MDNFKYLYILSLHSQNWMYLKSSISFEKVFQIFLHPEAVMSLQLTRLTNFASVQSSPTVGHDDLGPKPQIIMGRWEMSSVTKPRWLVKSRKFYGGRHTPHNRYTCARIIFRRQKY